MAGYTILEGDVLARLREMAAESVQCVVTSPPYWGLRDYGVKGQLGLERTPEGYVRKMVRVFEEVRRVLRKDGTCWLNLGDTYASAWSCGRRNVVSNGSCDLKKRINRRVIVGKKRVTKPGLEGSGQNQASALRSDEAGRKTPRLKEKDLVGVPWRVAFALQHAGWYLRSDIVWAKPNPMPSSCKDRPTTAHEYLFLLSKSRRYLYDWAAIAEECSANTHAKMKHPSGWATGGGDHTAVGHNRAPSSYNGSDFRKGKKARVHGNVGQGERSPRVKSVGTLPEAIAGPVEIRNRRSVWSIATQAFPEAHFATFPEALVEPCILAGSRVGDVVMDPFLGSGTTLAVAARLGREGVGIELNGDYVAMARRRIDAAAAQRDLFLHQEDQEGSGQLAVGNGGVNHGDWVGVEP